MFYPCNYGYINHTLSLDGDPGQYYGPDSVPAGARFVIRCRPVAAC
ncbi:inorganic diphosphatase [Shigella flexneri]